MSHREDKSANGLIGESVNRLIGQETGPVSGSADQPVSRLTDSPISQSTAHAIGRSNASYPPAEVSLSIREWIVTAVIVTAVLVILPACWNWIRPFDPPADYRIPYQLANDYWLFDWQARQAAADGRVMVIGDSVVWGHYVGPAETLSARLNALGGSTMVGRDESAQGPGPTPYTPLPTPHLPLFANLGVDGIHPAAMAGLVEHYGGAIRGRDVLLHCNLLWMSSPERDLSAEKEVSFNHSRLVPQFWPNLPCYREEFEQRLSIAMGNALPWMKLARHLRIACYGGDDVPKWTMTHPYGNPLASVAARDALARTGPPDGATGRTWRDRGITAIEPEWVDCDASFQWSRFKRTVEHLTAAGNRVFVVVGPLNEHMLKGRSLEAYRQRVAQVDKWLTEKHIPHFVPPALPSDQYADASHPLAQGYDNLARQLLADQGFAAWRRK